MNMNDCLMAMFMGLFLINFLTSIMVGIPLFFEYNENPPILCQQYLWEILDDKDINFIGKLILCILTIPFTIFYSVVVLVCKIGMFLIINAWKIFCVVFKKG